jgi:hypothetical protein
MSLTDQLHRAFAHDNRNRGATDAGVRDAVRGRDEAVP